MNSPNCTQPVLCSARARLRLPLNPEHAGCVAGSRIFRPAAVPGAPHAWRSPAASAAAWISAACARLRETLISSPSPAPVSPAASVASRSPPCAPTPGARIHISGAIGAHAAQRVGIGRADYQAGVAVRRPGAHLFGNHLVERAPAPPSARSRAGPAVRRRPGWTCGRARIRPYPGRRRNGSRLSPPRYGLTVTASARQIS